MPIVYIITNKTNNKSYIGQTVRSLEQRWLSHISSARQGSKFRFHSAIRKYGVDDWNLNILFEHDEILVVRKKEEELIEEYETMTKGYNAKPGGCGGWIVKEENYNEWCQKQSERSSGLNNGNSCKLTNDELVQIATTLCKKHQRILSHNELVSETALIGIRFPKTFTKFRFNGSGDIFRSILEENTGFKYKPRQRTSKHRELLSIANKGKKWWSCDELQKSICVKTEDILDKNYIWYRGRKYGNKN